MSRETDVSRWTSNMARGEFAAWQAPARTVEWAEKEFGPFTVGNVWDAAFRGGGIIDAYPRREGLDAGHRDTIALIDALGIEITSVVRGVEDAFTIRFESGGWIMLVPEPLLQHLTVPGGATRVDASPHLPRHIVFHYMDWGVEVWTGGLLRAEAKR